MSSDYLYHKLENLDDLHTDTFFAAEIGVYPYRKKWYSEWTEGIGAAQVLEFVKKHGAKEIKICCVGKEWILKKRFETLTEACAELGGEVGYINFEFVSALDGGYWHFVGLENEKLTSVGVWFSEDKDDEALKLRVGTVEEAFQNWYICGV